jgi:outer membrane protein assembly factor BamB
VVVIFFFCALVFICGCSDGPGKKAGKIQSLVPAQKETIKGFKNKGIEASKSDWPSFQGDIGNTGYSGLHFTGTGFKKLWEFSIGDHAWEYAPETASWSVSPCIAKTGGRMLLFIGSHDKNFYAIDTADGSLVWQRPLGGLAMWAPLFVKALKPVSSQSADRLIVTCSDRSIYCLNPETGEIVWCTETAPWSATVMPAVGSSPVLWTPKTGSGPFIIASIFHSDKAFFNSSQNGNIFVLDLNGKIVKKKKIAASPLSSPCLAQMGIFVNENRPADEIAAESVNESANESANESVKESADESKDIVFIADRAGSLMALTLPDLDILWKKVLSGQIYSSPSAFFTDSGLMVSIADFFGMISVFSGIEGDLVWSVKTGFFVNAVPGVSSLGRPALTMPFGGNLFFEAPAIYAGGFDRMVHAYDLFQKKRLFSFMTEKYVASNLHSLFINNRRAVIFSSLDRNLYAVDAQTGSLLFKVKTPDMLWHFERPGQTVWPGPVPVGRAESGGDTRGSMIIYATPGNTIIAYAIE